MRDRFERSETVFGAGTTAHSPALLNVYAQLGFDCVWLDHEHSGAASTDAPTFERIRLAADAAGIEPLVRVDTVSGSVVRKVLDAGIRNVVLPRIKTAAEVEEAVRASRFDFDGSPGERGVGTSLSNDWGNRSASYTEAEDRSVCIGVNLETKEAVANVDEILSVPGVGFGMLGPADLSVSLGHPLETDHPEVRDAIDTFLAAGSDHDVPIGIFSSFEGGVTEAVEKGYGLIVVGSEVTAARELLGRRLRDGMRAADRDA